MYIYVPHIYIYIYILLPHTGIPVFKDKNSGSANICALRQANLPDELSKRFGEIFCTFVYPHRYWVIDDQTKLPRLQSHAPQNLGPLMVMLVNSLLHWYDGKMVTDHSKVEGNPSRYFLLRAMLLFWCGDYPGLGEASNFVHSAAAKAACHWCTYRAIYSLGLSKTLFEHFRRWLDPDDPLRDDPAFGAPEHRPPPPLTTLQDYLNAVKASESSELAWDNDEHPRKQTGVNGWCPLSLLPLWNMIKDFLPDLMHIVKNWYERTYLPLLKGKRNPTKNRNLKEPERTEENDHNYDELMGVYILECER